MLGDYQNLCDYLYEMDKQNGSHLSFQHTPQQDFLLEILEKGMPKQYLTDLSIIMGVDENWFKDRLEIKNTQTEDGTSDYSDKSPPRTIDVKEQSLASTGIPRLAPYTSEKLLKVYQMVNKVRFFADEYITDDSFDAGKWLAKWLDDPLPALNNVKPCTYMKTLWGLEIISQFLDVVLGDSYG